MVRVWCLAIRYYGPCVEFGHIIDNYETIDATDSDIDSSYDRIVHRDRYHRSAAQEIVKGVM
jgi:hypothetical protein